MSRALARSSLRYVNTELMLPTLRLPLSTQANYWSHEREPRRKEVALSGARPDGSFRMREHLFCRLGNGSGLADYGGRLRSCLTSVLLLIKDDFRWNRWPSQISQSHLQTTLRQRKLEKRYQVRSSSESIVLTSVQSQPFRDTSAHSLNLLQNVIVKTIAG